MRKLVLALMLAFGSALSFGQGANQYTSFSSVSTGATLNLGSTAITSHQLIWRTSGTVSTCQVQLDTSKDGSTWVAGGAIASQVCTSDGQSAIASSQAAYFRVNLTALSGGGTVTVNYAGAWAPPQTISGTVNTGIVSGEYVAPTANPCGNPAIVQNSTPVAITTATTTQLVAGVGGKQIFPCGGMLAMTGTILADTVQLVYGTGSTCTTPTNLTGAISSGILTAGATVVPVPLLQPSAVGQSLCAITTVGTTPTIEGAISYVLQ